jgi:hypothetical protein
LTSQRLLKRVTGTNETKGSALRWPLNYQQANSLS